VIFFLEEEKLVAGSNGIKLGNWKRRKSKMLQVQRGQKGKTVMSNIEDKFFFYKK